MRHTFLLAVLLLSACAPPSGGRQDTGLDALRLDSVEPALLLPGTKIIVRGEGFVDLDLGDSRLVFDGSVDRGRGASSVRFSAAATYVSPQRLELEVNDALIAQLDGGLNGRLSGTARVEVRSVVDMQSHQSGAVKLEADLAQTSTPVLTEVTDGPTWVNQPIALTGDGFLLGGGEGQTWAHLTGCFTPDSDTRCGPAVDVFLPIKPAAETDRRRASFDYKTSISGIGPGVFNGEVTLVNRHAKDTELTSSARSITLTVQLPQVSSVSTTAASLGQYVELNGGGFVGGADETEASTVLELRGDYVDTTGQTLPINVTIIPEFVSGPRLRYILDENDALGHAVDLRHGAGTLTGTVTPTVQRGAERITGDPSSVQLTLAPIKQVLYVHFLDSYLSSLRLFGLRAADPLIRARVLKLCAGIMRGVNFELRTEEPTDFALYSTVDIAGPDPLGQGTLGYDNTPGKDINNARLFDHIGGFNAVSQADGSRGYGGVFTESFFAFSEHPNDLAPPPGEPTPIFDRIFDPFRGDAGGDALTMAELKGLTVPELDSGEACPAADGDRPMQVACAVWTMGNLIGSTMIHEVGHSLGLADPYGDPTTFHNKGDAPNRLMDGGGQRPFEERAVLQGQGPAQFCTDEYAYLRDILRSDEPATTFVRPSCK